MKFIVRWTFRFLLLGIVVVVALFLLKDTLLKSLVENRIRKVTGMEVKIGGLEVALDRPVIRMENFVIYNQGEFGGSPLLDIPDLHLEYDFDSIMRKELHIKLLRLNLREMNLIETKNGQTNLSVFLDQISSTPSTNINTNAVSQVSNFKGIDTLNLSLGTLRFVSLKDPRRNQELKLNIKNQITQNLRSEMDLTLLLLKITIRHGLTLLLSPSHPPTGRPTNILAQPKN